MTTKKQPETRGRPKLPDEQARTEVIRMRATRAEKQAYDERGGQDWLRRELAQKPRFIGSAKQRWPKKD